MAESTDAEGLRGRLSRRDVLSGAGFRITHPRLKVLAALESSVDRHMRADEVFRAVTADGDPIGLATVYRVLTQFVDAGLITRRTFGAGGAADKSGAVYELEHGEHHDHLVCVRCGKVVEFVDHVIESRQRAAATRHGFTLGDHEMVLYGVCGAKACRDRKGGGR